MDKLILYRARLTGVLLIVSMLMLLPAAQGKPAPAAECETSGSDAGATSGLSPIADLTWISRFHDDIRTLSGSDTIPESRILEEVSSNWNDRIKGLPSDSLSAADSPVEKLLRLQIDHITSLLERPPSLGDNTGTGSEARLDEAADAMKQLASLTPLVLASRDSMRGSLLVISSVGCACEMERCSTMVELFASMQGDTLGGPIAMVDLMQVPVLEDLLGQVTIPYWIFFDEKGSISTLIEGASDAADVRAGILAWLGIPGAASNSEPAANRKGGP